MKVVLKSPEADKSSVRGWLKPDTQYLVLALEASGTRGVAYRIESEDNRTPALFEPEMFRLVDNRLSALWVGVQQDGYPVQFMPAKWSEEGFWERFFDGDPDAHRRYEDAVTEMRDELEPPAG